MYNNLQTTLLSACKRTRSRAGRIPFVNLTIRNMHPSHTFSAASNITIPSTILGPIKSALIHGNFNADSNPLLHAIIKASPFKASGLAFTKSRGLKICPHGIFFLPSPQLLISNRSIRNFLPTSSQLTQSQLRQTTHLAHPQSPSRTQGPKRATMADRSCYQEFDHPETEVRSCAYSRHWYADLTRDSNSGLNLSGSAPLQHQTLLMSFRHHTHSHIFPIDTPLGCQTTAW